MKKLLLLCFIVSPLFGAEQSFPIPQYEVAESREFPHEKFKKFAALCSSDDSALFLKFLNKNKNNLNAPHYKAFDRCLGGDLSLPLHWAIEHSPNIDNIKHLLKCGVNPDLLVSKPVYNLSGEETILSKLACKNSFTSLDRVELVRTLAPYSSVDSGLFTPSFHASPLALTAFHASLIEREIKKKKKEQLEIAAILICTGASKQRALWEIQQISRPFLLTLFRHQATEFLNNPELDTAIKKERMLPFWKKVKQSGYKNIAHYLNARKQGLIK